MIQLFRLSLLFAFIIILVSCGSKTEKVSEDINEDTTMYPSDILPSFDQWGIRLGNGEVISDLENFEHKNFFYATNDGSDWVVYKTPNSGVTSPNSSNTRTELGQRKHWLPINGGNMTGTVKVMHVSTSGDARVAASYSVVIGQIHSSDGHENEPLKIFYKKFPGHTKGSVYWNYEINTEGDNSGRWDFSTAVWGYDMSTIGDAPDSYPEEPQDGIEIGEEFRYEVNVSEGIMYLTFTSEGHETKTFTKSLLRSNYAHYDSIPQQILTLYSVIGRDGTERVNAYQGEMQFFKQGAYNQTNGKDPADNMVWSTGAETFGGDIEKQYANGSYAEVWIKDATIGPAK